MKPHDGVILDAVFSDDGTYVATLTNHDTVMVSRSDDGVEVMHLEPALEGSTGVIFSPTGDHLLVHGAGEIGVWRVASPDQPILRGPGRISGPHIVLLVGSQVQIGRLDHPEHLKPLPGRIEPPNLGFKADVPSTGKHVVVVHDNGTAWVWRADGTGKPRMLQVAKRLIPSTARAEALNIRDALFSPDGSQVLLVLDPGAIAVWPLAADQPTVMLSQEGPIDMASFSPDGSHILAISRDGRIQVFASDGSFRARKLRPPTTIRQQAGFLVNGDVVTDAADNTVRVWDLDEEFNTLRTRRRK
ncbi:WD40 repeat domain-containing protein [Nannocystis sp.]|uniref:WD40 repeat domain-containing protein n=1 Tax=Nannocystis sp. TaxID=1962667 RepID=UPI002600F71B|nr:WD40 repeat domain-containing protein [Nannocystis sp.]MBK7828408.1 WD40 repeat domain-containing protein [Nannocystis sp.]